MSERILVIGGGLIGAASALALQSASFATTLVERDEPGRGCSYGNAGLIADDHILPLSRPSVIRQLPGMLLSRDAPLRIAPRGLAGQLPWLLRFALAARPSVVAEGLAGLAPLLARARPALDRLIEREGLQHLFLTPGALYVFETEAADRAAREEERLLAEHGVACEHWAAEAVHARLPGLGVPVAGGRFYPRMLATSDPFALVQVLVERFRARGGILLKTEVHTVGQGADGRPRLHSGAGPLEADQVVVAAGAAGGRLLRALGTPVPITGERGYHVMLQNGPAIDLSVTFMERGFVATPMSAGLRFAGTVELGAAQPTPSRADVLVRHARTLFPGCASRETDRWSGERPTLPDYRPVIGRLAEAPRVIAAFGHQHLGLTLAAVTGELVAELAAGRPSSVPLAPFRAERFRSLFHPSDGAGP